MIENIIFKSEAMKSIIKKDSITPQEFEKAYYNLEVDGNKLDLNDSERETFIEDLNELQNFSTKDSITDIKIYNMALEEDYELTNELTKFAKTADYIRIENSQFNTVETVFQNIFEKENITNNTLSKQKRISKFVYDRPNQNLITISENAKFLEDYKQYADIKNLILEIASEEGKQDIIDNIDLLREHRKGIIFLKDTSPNENISDLSKYENYANGKIVLFKSNIIKETMGFDRLPTDASAGISYNLRIDGQKMLEQEIYKLEGKELDVFLSELNEISKYCPLSGISIKNISIPDNADLNGLTKVFENLNRINIENSYIPNLKEIINNIKDKSKIETIKIKDSGLQLEDIDTVAFKNIYSLLVEQSKENQLVENLTELSECESNIELKISWYRRAWYKLKKLPGLKRLFGKDSIKALPEASSEVLLNASERNKN